MREARPYYLHTQRKEAGSQLKEPGPGGSRSLEAAEPWPEHRAHHLRLRWGPVTGKARPSKPASLASGSRFSEAGLSRAPEAVRPGWGWARLGTHLQGLTALKRPSSSLPCLGWTHLGTWDPNTRRGQNNYHYTTAPQTPKMRKLRAISCEEFASPKRPAPQRQANILQIWFALNCRISGWLGSKITLEGLSSS